MPEGTLSGELREAVDELQAYLSDQLAPLLVLDSARLLLAHAPELGAEVVRAWVNGQQRTPGSNVTMRAATARPEREKASQPGSNRQAYRSVTQL